MSVNSRELYEFIIRAGLRLEAENRTVATAIMIIHRLQNTETLGAAAIYLASKHEEDMKIGIRDVVNVTHRILHPDEDPIGIDSTQWEMRKGIARIEFVILRELHFNLDFEHPFNILAVYLETLRSWMPREFQVNSIAQTATALCRDIFVQPDFIIDHAPESVAIACIGIALHIYDIHVPKSRDWFAVLHKSMTESKLRSMEEKIIDIIEK